MTVANAKIARLKEEMDGLDVEIAELKQGLSESTQLRVGEKANNENTVAAATVGLDGVTQAMKILKDFYDNALLQTGARYAPPNADAEGKTVGDRAPETFEGDYAGNQDAASGIIGELDVIKSDFEGTIEATNTAESEAEEAFDKYSSDTEKDITEKEALVKSKDSEQKVAKGLLVDTKDKYKEHYKVKVARREQEIASLKNAYTILDEMR